MTAPAPDRPGAGEHLTADALADTAVDGARGLGDAARQHLQRCDVCAAELDELRGTLRWARSARLDDTEAPEVPPEAWVGVAERLGLSDRRPRPLPTSDAARTEPASTDPARTDAGDEGVPVVGPDAPRRSRRLLVLAAGVVALAVVGAAAVASTAGGPAEVVALQPPAGAGAAAAGSGEARLVAQGPDRRLDVQVAGLSGTPGYYEVWLLDPEDGRVLSLGALGADGRADLQLPAGLDLRRYDVVDVSAEPWDGDPAHSGDSVLRGRLGTA